jgi:hypothetical protein
MKSIGITADGDRIVEMREGEFREFQRLQEAVTGSTEWQVFSPDPHRMMDWDFANVFHIIRAYTLNRLRIKEMQSLLDELKARLDKE